MSQQEEEREQEQQEKKEISPQELIKVNNELGDQLIQVAAYTLYYNAADTVDESGDSTTTPLNQSEWVRHKYTGYFSLKLKRSGEFTAVPRYLDRVTQHYPKTYENKNVELRLGSLFGGNLYRKPPKEIGDKKQLTASIHNGTYEYDLRQDTFTSALIPQDSHGNIYGEKIVPELFNLGKEKGLIPKNSVLFDNVIVDPTESETTHTYLGKDQDQRRWQVFKPVGRFKPNSGTFASEDLKKFNYEIQKMMDKLEFMQQRDHLDGLRLQKEKLEMQKTAARIEELEAIAAFNNNNKKEEKDDSPWPIDARRSLPDNMSRIDKRDSSSSSTTDSNTI
jgi:hypothetical protein